MRYEDISKASLGQLVRFIESFGNKPAPIPVAKNCLFILRAQVGFFESGGKGYNGRTFDVKLYGPESGFERYKWAVGGISKGLNYRNYLADLGVAVQLLSDRAAEAAFYEYIYKNNILLPSQLWYDENVLYAPSELYSVPQENWDRITPYPIDREELMSIIFRDYSNNTKVIERKADYLAFQTVEALMYVIEQIPALKSKFEVYSQDIEVSKRFLLCYISFIGISNSKEVRKLLREIHDPNGSRAQMVSAYLETNRPKIIFRSENTQIDNILMYPPYWFEKEYIEGAFDPERYGLKDEESLVRYLIEDVIVDRQYDAMNDVLYYIDENDPSTQVPNRLPTHHEIFRMVEKKDPRLKDMSKSAIMRSMGFVGNSVYEDDKWNNINLLNKVNVRLREDRRRFEIYTVFNMCKSRHDNIYMYEYVDFVFGYGTYLNMNCMSAEDLVAAFTSTDGGIPEARFPVGTGLFTPEEITQLKNMCGQQNPQAIRDFTQRTNPMNKAIDSILNKSYSVEMMTSIIQRKQQSDDPVDRKDIDLLKLFMIHLFEAGMYQRLWKGVVDGVATPYPMKTKETCDAVTKQSEIDIRMAPSLTAASEAYDNMSQTFKEQFNHFRAFESTFGTGEDARMSSSKIVTIFQQTIGLRNDAGELISEEEIKKSGRAPQGNYCVGFVSSIFIITAYYFLGMLNQKIEGFDINKLQSSTHRTNE